MTLRATISLMPVSPVTIGSTHEAGYGLYTHCLDCRRAKKLNLPKLIAVYGADRRPMELPLKCSGCGSRRFSVTIYPLDGPKGAVSKAPG